ncbi:hypothetical protein VP01_2260g1 [Puccinia sorghi]|uniref:Uncharacterized protein n=1 Tax=Puccinia sorghi TaxID=27349 RepID=A0A0L6V888_9BASI|nr:hypothetical protein VP01_2260g1 [Puccinia sorghi]
MWGFHGRCHKFLEWSGLVYSYISNPDSFHTSFIPCYDKKFFVAYLIYCTNTSFVVYFVILKFSYPTLFGRKKPNCTHLVYQNSKRFETSKCKEGTDKSIKAASFCFLRKEATAILKILSAKHPSFGGLWGHKRTSEPEGLHIKLGSMGSTVQPLKMYKRTTSSQKTLKMPLAEFLSQNKEKTKTEYCKGSTSCAQISPFFSDILNGKCISPSMCLGSKLSTAPTKTAAGGTLLIQCQQREISKPKSAVHALPLAAHPQLSSSINVRRDLEESQASCTIACFSRLKHKPAGGDVKLSIRSYSGMLTNAIKTGLSSEKDLRIHPLVTRQRPGDWMNLALLKLNVNMISQPNRLAGGDKPYLNLGGEGPIQSPTTNFHHHTLSTKAWQSTPLTCNKRTDFSPRERRNKQECKLENAEQKNTIRKELSGLDRGGSNKIEGWRVMNELISRRLDRSPYHTTSCAQASFLKKPARRR